MKKVVLSVVAAVALTTSAFAADMPVKAKLAPVAAPSPWEIAFGTALTTDYVLRGVSQSNRRPAIQGYFEPRYTFNDMLQVYAGIWGSSLYSGFADAEFDIYGGARLTFGSFGLDLGYVYYYYPDGIATSNSGSFGEFYAKPSFKFNDWLTVGAIIDGGNNFNNGAGIVGSKSAYYYSANAVITLPWTLGPVAVSLNPEIGRQEFKCTTVNGSLCTSYTYWDVGLDFVYKTMTLDLRYWSTNASGAAQFTSGGPAGGRNLSSPTFVATLKFDTTVK